MQINEFPPKTRRKVLFVDPALNFVNYTVAQLGSNGYGEKVKEFDLVPVDKVSTLKQHLNHGNVQMAVLSGEARRKREFMDVLKEHPEALRTALVPAHILDSVKPELAEGALHYAVPRRMVNFKDDLSPIADLIGSLAGRPTVLIGDHNSTVKIVYDQVLSSPYAARKFNFIATTDANVARNSLEIARFAVFEGGFATTRLFDPSDEKSRPLAYFASRKLGKDLMIYDWDGSGHDFIGVEHFSLKRQEGFSREYGAEVRNHLDVLARILE